MNRGKDEFRVERLKAEMRRAGLDYLVLRLGENVLYTTGYWPIFGASAAIVPLKGEPSVLYVEGEQGFVADTWVDDIEAYPFFNLQTLANPRKSITDWLKRKWQTKGYNPQGKIGYEGDFELVASNNVAAEARVMAPSSLRAYQETLPDATWVDASAAIRASRIIKSPIEIELLRLACELCGIGYAAAREIAEPGVKESALSAIIESRIHEVGVGYKGVRRARGFCFAMSGPNSFWSRRPFCIDSDRHAQAGEQVLLELDTAADGYHNDLTRMLAIGQPSPRVQEAWGVINEAVDAALAITRPGTPCSELNRVSMDVIEKRGWGQYFYHHVGHGVGLQFHEPPTLHPASQEILQPGMTIAIEPAVYVKGWGGMRIEENVAITADGYDLLSTYSRAL